MQTDFISPVDEPGAGDPLSARWIEAYFRTHGHLPTDEDRQDRLLSLIFSGRGAAGLWDEEDWAFYYPNRRALWVGNERWPGEEIAAGYDRFQIHLERLAGYYGKDRDSRDNFARAIGLVWGGIAYEGSVFMALIRASVGDHLLQLHDGAAGWLSKYVDDANPAHHWVAAFLTGYHYGTAIGVILNSVRDIAQYFAQQGGTRGDIYLGNVAARHGHLLSRGFNMNPQPYSMLFSRMRQDMAIDGDNKG